MPIFKVTQKQGSKTFVSEFEAKSAENLITFLKAVSTAKVSSIHQVVYSDSSSAPIDDFNYFSQFKGFVNNNDTRLSRQLLIHHIKLSVSQEELANLIRSHLVINNSKIDGISCTIFKK